VLDRLKSNRTEFGSLAGLLTNYFQQRAELVKEIAVRKALEEHLSHMAHHDNLTGVPNRALLQDRLGQALARARRDKRPLGVLMLDLDGFKPVNDKYGHEAGDELLRSVADRLSALLRKSDTVARVGGDEFVLVLPDVGGAEDAARVARRVLEAIQRPFTVKQVEVRIGTSIGIALYPFDGADGEELMKNADTAMYRVKGRGRNDYEFFSVALSSGAQERNKLEADLREAIDKGDFAVHYQPQVELSSGRVVGAEAVVYWPHRERGLLTPDAFMPLAEETGLIVPISDWLFKTACRDAATWRKDGHRTDVLSISLSVRQFRRPDLADQLAEFLRQSGLEPEHFEIELNETVLLANPEVSLETLKRIHGIGVCVALEDFGTGHSALTHLKRFGIDTVKLARTVTQGLLTNQEHQAIVAAAVSMVHQLQGPRIIADGIRTDAERAKLLSLGCDFGQGPRFSPPVPLAEFALLLKKGSLI
jgi:diguanylate cyclase (GGDEF)-like protein